MIRKIGILTFHASHNYGSMLQTYALQTYLTSQGNEAKVINFRSFAQKALYPKPKRANVDELLRNPRLFLQNRSKWMKFEDFMKTHYSTTRESSNLTQLEDVINEEQFDAIITGGDQIWNMNCRDFSIAYYLPFDTPNVRRISYSPSFGGMHYWEPQHYGNTLKNLLDNYDFVSAREKEAAKFLTELLGRDVPSVADPTLLLKREEYEDLAGSEAIVKGDYLLFYSPWKPRRFSAFVNSYAHRQGLKAIASNGGKMSGDGWVYLNDCGPVEFLNLLRYAKIIIGESFHLAVLSMILHKPFYVVTDKNEARMGGLLKSAGLSSRYVLIDKGFPQEDQIIDWGKVDAYIDDERKTSIEFLTRALYDENN